MYVRLCIQRCSRAVSSTLFLFSPSVSSVSGFRLVSWFVCWLANARCIRTSQAMREAARVLKPGGRICLLVISVCLSVECVAFGPPAIECRYDPASPDRHAGTFIHTQIHVHTCQVMITKIIRAVLSKDKV